MAGYLRQNRILAVLTVLLLLLCFCSCFTYVPRDGGTVERGTQAGTQAESTAKETETHAETDTDARDEGGVETDSKGFPNLPEDDQTKRY